MTGEAIDLQHQQALLEYAPNEVISYVRDLEDAVAARARVDPAVFATYVLKDEDTARPIRAQPMHGEWHGLSSTYQRLLIWAHVEAGKTQQMSIARAMWELGRNPQCRIAIVSNTDRQAQFICMSIAKYVEESPELHRVFPHLKRQRGAPWTHHQLFMERLGVPKDPSVRTCGIHGNILGSRIDLLIVDDILDYENTINAGQRDDLWHWFLSTMEGRLTSTSRVICIGTAWHKDDIMHRWARRPEWMAVRYPVVEQMPDGSQKLSFPERWPLARIEAKRSILGAIEYARQLLCVARTDEEARFKESWINACMLRGEGRTLTHALEFIPPGYRTFTGVDLGVRTKRGSDLTSIFTIIVHPNEDREVLDIQSGRWTAPDIVKKIIKTHDRYHSIVIVESNSAQEFIVQFTKEQSAVPVRSFNTGTNKHHPEFGLESLAVEMENAKWIIPSRNGRPSHPEVGHWINEMLYYDPNGHPGDRLMASWFAREGSRVKRPKGHIGRMDLLTR